MRPESRLDLAAELESRLISASQTEDNLDTLLNPWAGPGETTMTTTSLGTPMIPQESDRAIIDVPSEPDGDPNASADHVDLPVVARKIDDDAALEQQHMARQLRHLAQELTRAKSEAAIARILDRSVDEAATWSARELRLAQMAVSRWRGLRWHRMAGELLSYSVDIKEANIIA